MDVKRLRQIEEIYNAALAIAPLERTAFFESRCGQDAELRCEVESLLSFDNTFDSLLDAPLDSLAAEILFEDKEEFSLAGRKISHYQIEKLLGTGGMGEVYLAEDTKLDRKAALKILPSLLAADKERMSRFVREAKFASSLNHPNILTVYEINEFEGIPFIAAEFVDGKTLNQLLKNDSLNLKTALQIAIQIASALEEAHSAGIIHRDIKPDNVMMRPNGLVKVLDFGIAKLSGSADQPSSEGKAVLLNVTGTNKIIGTVNYMSPEQAKGKAVDARTDIFSFGVVLYEMISGALPFAGATATETISAIVQQEPLPLDSDVPFKIEEIVGKCLRKDRTERYQTIKDVRDDLEIAKRELELQNKIERIAAPVKAESKTVTLQATTADEFNRITASQAISKNPRTKYLTIGLLGLIVLVGGLFFDYRTLTATKQIESIAVMPFADESGNADAEYLSDGMTEMLITSLSSLPNLNVKSRSSVFRYKGKETNPQNIAKELNVQAVLNGRIASRGQDISLFVELIDVSLDKVIWSETYNRRQTDLVRLQADIARDVSSKIKFKLSGEEAAKVTKTYTADPEAYQLYLKGRYYFLKYDNNGFRKAIEYYRQALEIDPNYALAYYGIANAYHWAGEWYLPADEAESEAKKAALKALELDDSLADAHRMLGTIAFWYDYDWAAAEREWQRAAELGSPYSGHALYFSAMGRHDEAVKTQEMSVKENPLDAGASSGLETVYLFAGRYDDAIEQGKKTLELDQNNWGAYWSRGQALERKKQYAEAIESFEKCRVLAGKENTSMWGYLGYTYAVAGRRAEAVKILNELKELSKHQRVSPYSIAVVYAGLNDKDRAFEWLDEAYNQRSYFMTLLKVDTPLDNLRPDPRFKALLKRMNLPE